MPTARSPKSAVRIRCYRQGFGDCFLLSFRTGKARPCHVLIDCGLWPSGATHTATMRAIVADIAKATGGTATKRGAIDVLVVTHEHWDHLSGFNQARDLFEEKLTVRAVWMAWTEDAADPLAKKLRREQEKKLRVAEQMRARLATLSGSPGFSESGRAALRQLDGLLGFFGATEAKGGVQGAMKFVREEWSGPERAFHRPGAQLALPGVAGVRVYVLGPPRDAAKLRRESSTKQGALYELFFGASQEDSLLAALGALDDEVARYRNPAEIGQPFDRAHRCPIDLGSAEPAAALDGELAKFFTRHYADAPWRRIDSEWLHSGGALALRLDRGINNTSLVLAFELPDGRVLLFPGDAQLGNWESWHDATNAWPSREPGGARIGASDLLARTVFYKVGHHGSHNATAHDLGLEMMTHPDLIAYLPTSHAMALENDWERIPLPGLVRRLREKARGRVWFSVEYAEDGKNFTNPRIDALAALSKAERTALKKAVTERALSFDFAL
jgi:hypothetical protein